MAGNVKNTFIDFQDETEKQRNPRRIKTEPVPFIAYYPGDEGPLGARALEEEFFSGGATSVSGGPQILPVALSSATPAARVAFLADGADGGDDEEKFVDIEIQRSVQTRQVGLPHNKTYDSFDATPKVAAPPAAAATPRPTFLPQPPPQVFTIPIPAGLPVGAHHAIQLPMGLPAGSTILVLATEKPMATLARVPGGKEALLQGPAGADDQFALAEAQLYPQTVTKAVLADGQLRIIYVVDARKLKANDKAIISPPFEISAANPGQYRVIINPSPTKARGGATFKNSAGMGNVQLKSENPTEGRITFYISIGHGAHHLACSEQARGPIEHDFAHGGVCGLPRKQEEWDFNKMVDVLSRTFTVCLDIVQ